MILVCCVWVTLMKMGDFIPIKGLVLDYKLDITRLRTQELYCEGLTLFCFVENLNLNRYSFCIYSKSFIFTGWLQTL